MEKENDKDEIYYLRSVIDDNEKIIEEKDKLLKDLGERLESKTKKVKALEEDLDDVRNEASNLLEEKNERDNLVVIMGEKFLNNMVYLFLKVSHIIKIFKLLTMI